MLDINLAFEFIDETTSGIIICDESFNIMFWNQTLCDWTKISKKKIVGKNLLELYPHLKKRIYYNRMKMLLGGGPPVVFSPQFHPHFIPILIHKESKKMKQQTIVKFFYSQEF